MEKTCEFPIDPSFFLLASGIISWRKTPGVDSMLRSSEIARDWMTTELFLSSEDVVLNSNNVKLL